MSARRHWGLRGNWAKIGDRITMSKTQCIPGTRVSTGQISKQTFVPQGENPQGIPLVNLSYILPGEIKESMFHRGKQKITREKLAKRKITRGRFTFRRLNPQGETFMSPRKYQGGRQGLPQVDTITLHQARDMSKYQELIAYSNRASVFHSQSACTWLESFRIFAMPPINKLPTR